MLCSIWSWIKDFQVAFGITLSVVLGIYIVFGKSPFASIHRHSVDKLEKFRSVQMIESVIKRLNLQLMWKLENEQDNLPELLEAWLALSNIT